VLEGAGVDGAAPAAFTDTDPRLLELWEHLADPRDRDAEVAWRVAHWRLLNGEDVAFDPEEFRRLEERVVAHAGRHDNPAAHARADQGGLDRGAELARVTVPTLVLEAPNDPINPPPAAARIAAAIPTADLVTVPGMGHALPRSVLQPLATAVLGHTERVDAAQ
jgi:pimeloyl-ACP methyl ester carboxylesterase